MVLSSLGKLSKLWFYSLMKSTAFLLVQLIQDVSRDKVTLSYTPQSYVPMSLGNSEKLPSFLLHAKLGIFIRKVYKKGLEFVVWIEDLGQWKVSPKVLLFHQLCLSPLCISVPHLIFSLYQSHSNNIKAWAIYAI